ncbi:MAG: hypothetical protein ABIJ56_09340 [Pseudomonadota bacterium]
MKKLIRKTSLILALAALLGTFAFTGCEEDCKEWLDVCLLDSECCSGLTCTGSICVEDD